MKIWTVLILQLKYNLKNMYSCALTGTHEFQRRLDRLWHIWTCFFFTYFWIRLLVLDRNRNLGYCFPIIFATALIISTRNVFIMWPLYMYYFCKQTIAACEQRLWIGDISDSNESGCLYGFSFNISYFCSSLFISICNQIFYYFRYHNLL